MNELLGIDPNIPIFHLVPFVVFGPIFFLVLYNLGLKEIFRPSPEAREQRRLYKLEKAREADERKQKMTDAGMKLKVTRRTPGQLAIQGAMYVMFALVIGYFSSSPAYVAHPPEKAQVKLSFSHAGRHVKECKKRSREELAKLAANMRAPMSCSRERWPVIAHLMVDGESLYQGVAIPAGLSRDGHSSFYQEFPVAAGKHTITVGVWDGRAEAGEEEYDFTLERDVDLQSREILVIGFDNQAGQVTLK